MCTSRASLFLQVIVLFDDNIANAVKLTSCMYVDAFNPLETSNIPRSIYHLYPPFNVIAKRRADLYIGKKWAQKYIIVRWCTVTNKYVSRRILLLILTFILSRPAYRYLTRRNSREILLDSASKERIPSLSPTHPFRQAECGVHCIVVARPS